VKTTRAAVISSAAAVIVATGMAASTGASAQSYPTKPVRMVVPFAPGGIADLAARALSQRLSDALGASVVVENRGGAGGIPGSDIVAKSPADGYTIMLTSISHSINLSVSRKLPYDTRRDFVAITSVTDAPNILTAHPSLPVRSVKDLIALAKSRPGEITYASSGNGTSTHLSGELFKVLTKVDMIHVPYKGGGPAVVDLLGGHVQLMFATLPTVLQHARGNRLRALAVTGSTRFSLAPEFPTIAESGVSGYEVSGWTGMFAPAGTPREIVSRLANETTKALATPAIRELFAAQGSEPSTRTPEQFATFFEAEIVKWKKVVDFSGMKAD
jgi:tripartite-type tricarboxylate transporter receptor subunit TctC